MTKKGTPQVWILAGQSNMEGVGELSRAPAPDERVTCLTDTGWVKAVEPLHGAGVGPGLAFGLAMAESAGLPIGLIPCAKGATSLDQWSQRGADSLTDRMLEKIRRGGIKPSGMLWYQGESDARDAGLASTYGARMEAWIGVIRNELKAPALPVLLVQLGRYALPSPPEVEAGWGLLREAQRQLALRVPGVFLTSAVDLGLTDIIHLNAVSAIRVGRRLARLASGHEGPRITALEGMSLPRGLGAIRIRCSGVSGVWRPADHMSGFQVFGPDGLPPRDGFVINASPDPEDPQSILVILNRPPDRDMRLAYGMGANPYCNVTDGADMPLCAFLQV